MSLDVDKVKQNNQELKLIINNSWDGIALINQNTKLIYFNNAFMPMFGFTKEELAEINFLELVENSYKNKFLHLFKNIDKSNASILCTRKDKMNIYLQITLSKSNHDNTFVMNARDITKEITNDKIIDNYVLKTSINTNGTLIQASDAFCKIMGYKKEELLNKNLLDFEVDNKTSLKLWEACKKKLPYNGLVIYRKQDGEALYMEVKSRPTHNKYGDILGFIFLMFDLSSEYKLKTKIEEQKDLILQQSKIAIMSETIQMLAHQWRQPLNIISINSQSLDISLDEETIDKKYLSKGLKNIKNEVDSLSLIIENFQQITSTKAIKVETNADEIMKEAINIFRNSKDIENIDFLVETIETPSFITYKNELTTILINLLINAKEAILRNSIKNGVIKLKEYHLNNNIFFEISDNGRGVDKEILDKIFEPYFSTKETKHGVGLGLYMCKTLIQMHLQGKIEIENHPLGARFIISLPMKGKE